MREIENQFQELNRLAVSVGCYVDFNADDCTFTVYKSGSKKRIYGPSSFEQCRDDLEGRHHA
jgi:hypothetical protein